MMLDYRKQFSILHGAQVTGKSFGQHYTTSGHNFSVLTLASVNICIMSP